MHFQVGETRSEETIEVHRKIDRVGVREANKLHDFQNYKISNEEDNYVKARLKGEALQ
ncbi:hypothetical protein PTT_07114 [Pyrenophora teres f. teres 0-1]|uniref:Uncharacterized protein n=1 Tax=Pyrenophora teres f. teres (strain 0-1) TaxID=861557 RepID=E3RGY2_PYRTT|nr:hypothetical protein PTT_07114 [Pyrenophora teres f. teres 0-1]